MTQRVFTGLVILVCMVSEAQVGAAAQQPVIADELDSAKSLYQDGRLEEAISALRGVIAKLNALRDVRDRTRQLSEAPFHLGLTYLAMRNESAAVENFRQVASSRTASSSRIFIHLGY